MKSNSYKIVFFGEEGVGKTKAQELRRKILSLLKV